MELQAAFRPLQPRLQHLGVAVAGVVEKDVDSRPVRIVRFDFPAQPQGRLAVGVGKKHFLEIEGPAGFSLLRPLVASGAGLAMAFH